MAKKIQINSIEELNEIVLRASKIRDDLIAIREAKQNNNEWKEIATLIHEKSCQRGLECSWNKEHNLGFEIDGEIIADDFIDWNGSERLIYATKAQHLLFEYDSYTIKTILNIL